MPTTRLVPLAALLVPVIPLALIPAAPAHADAFVVTGDVVDGLDAALAGVTVRPVGGPSTASVTTDAEGEYALTLVAGRYTLEYAKAGYATTTYDGISAAVVVVDADGDASVEIDGEAEPVVDNVLDTVTLPAPAPKAVTAPALLGTVAPGETVEATVGTWNPDVKDVEAGEDWRDYVMVEWLLDGKPADEYSDGYYLQKFDVPAEAGGKRLSFRITIEDAEGVWAPIVHTSAAVVVPRAQAELEASYAGGKVKVAVEVPGTDRPTGTVTVLEGTKKVGKAKLSAKSKGKATVKVRLKKGKHKLTVVFDGGKGVEGDSVKVKAKA
jgi:hypothetical protein